MDKYITKIQFRQDTSTNFKTANPILAAGEPAYELDTGAYKIGNGTDAYTVLPYQAIPEESITECPADGKLYGRERLENEAVGSWSEVVIPEIDTRKNLNDLLEADYNTEINFGVVVKMPDNTTQKLYGKKVYEDITVLANEKKTDGIIENATSIIQFGGSIEYDNHETFALPCNSDEMQAYLSLDKDANRIDLISKANKDRVSKKANIWVLYTKAE